ncbi:hypothetical protein EBR43_02730 [bacterium]|nr:hypothetical protein [bacterium]NBX72093.1 hypothetical protein [bacterium]
MFDFILTIVFFLMYKTYGLSAALLSAILLSSAWFVYHWIKKDEVVFIKKLTNFSIIIFALISIIFQSPRAFQFKTSVVYAIASLAFLLTPMIKKKTVFELMTSLPVNSSYYRHINNIMVIVFLIGSLTNLYVVFHYSLDQWVFFKILLSFTVATIMSICLVFLYKKSQNN